MNDLPYAANDVLDRLEEENDVLVSQLARVEALFIPSIPSEVVYRKIDGDNPVTVWREHRGLTVESLADAAEVSPEPLVRWEQDQPITLASLPAWSKRSR